jgi:hypothetical protein
MENELKVGALLDEQHVYHHYDNDGPRVSVKAEKNSKGFNYEAHVQGAKTVDEAMALLNEAVAKLKAAYETTA